MDAFSAEWIGGEWLAAWNGGDLDRIVARCSDDVVMTGPLIPRSAGRDVSTFAGKPDVRQYVRQALDRQPRPRWEFIDAFPGVDSVVLMYRRTDDVIGADVLRFDADGRVREVLSHCRDV